MTPEEKAAHSAYMRGYRQRNLEEIRAKEREWEKHKPSRQPGVRKAKAAEKKAARIAARKRELEEVIPFIELAEVVYKIAKVQRQREMSASYYARNREKCQAIARVRVRQERVDHPERVRARDKARHYRDKEKIAAGLKPKRVRDFATPERRQKRREKYAIDPSDRKAAFHKRRAMKKSAGGTFTKKDVQALYSAQGGLCFYCPTSLEGGYHVDHKTPLSRGGSNNAENIALSCASCNLRKHARTAEEFKELLVHEKTCSNPRVSEAS